MLTAADDADLREAALSWLTARSNDGREPVSREDLADFRFRGERVPLIDRQRGIRKPAFLDAALSIITVYRAEGTTRPYEDGIGADGLIRYKWRGVDRDHPENRALRVAMQRRLPLIWFFGVGPGMYQPVFPVYLAGEEPEQHQFALAIDELYGLVELDTPVEAQLRRYIMSQTKHRLHQPVFRSTVLRAYEHRCAVCNLGHSSLLDAAHIVADNHERGDPTVRNGLALCKLHHSAYDGHYIGISGDLVVHVAPRLLAEVDGPTLRHGLQDRHGQPLMVLPRTRRERPDPELLEMHYADFQNAQPA